ncbi:MAG TPA: EF-hand domain-containing protein [Luteolibacter sp.]
MKTISVSLALAGALAATAVALPGPQDSTPPPPPEGRGEKPDGPPWNDPEREAEFWKKFDTDHNGAISREEFFALPRIAKLPEERRVRIFERLDKDHDGSLSKEEIQEMRRGPGGMRRGMPPLERLDTDHSGGVSLEEFKAAPFVQKLPVERQEEMFHRLDTDGDGQITPKDRPPHPEGEGERRPWDGSRLFKRLDADGDGGVSFEEFQKAPFIARLSEDEQEKRFQELDRNGDKKLTEDEMPKPPRPPQPPPKEDGPAESQPPE